MIIISNRKIDARNFATIRDIIRCLSLVQSLLEGRNAPMWHIGNQGVKEAYLYMPSNRTTPFNLILIFEKNPIFFIKNTALNGSSKILMSPLNCHVVEPVKTIITVFKLYYTIIYHSRLAYFLKDYLKI